MNLSGKNIFITGGSRGIGAGIAKEAAQRGARVAVSYNSNSQSAEKTLSELTGEGHFAVALQLSDEASVEKACKEVLNRFDNKIDGVVNNAGITKDQILLRMKTTDFDDVIQTNLKGHFLVTKSFLKSMFRGDGGSFVHLTSVVGQTGQSGQANYAASKAALEAFSKSLAREMASRNIRSNCVAPGFINTDMTQELSDEQRKYFLDNIPLGRIAETREVAEPVCFLLGNESSYITGHTLSVNGGLFMN